MLLLDTHALLWWMADDPALGRLAREAIANGENEVFVSAASVWEIEIKRAIGKLSAPDNLAEAIAACSFQSLDISYGHATVAGRLPRHHNDPFDRMLVAQAMEERLTVVTRDPAFQAYDVSILAADA